MIIALTILLIILPNLAAAQQNTRKPWQIVISAGFGYDDNVARLDDTLTIGTPVSTLPALSDRESSLARFTFNGTYDLLGSDQHILTAGYYLFTDVFLEGGGVHNFNFLEHKVWSGYQRKLAPQTVGSFKLSDIYTTSGGDPIRNSVLLEPALVHRLNEIVTAELNGLIRFNDFKTPLPFGGAKAADQDGELYEISPVFFISIPNTTIQTHLRYRHEWSRTDGGAFDYNGDAVSTGLSFRLPWQVDVNGLYWHIWRRYNALGPTPARDRRDDIDIFQVTVTRPITRLVKFYVDYVHTDVGSNAVLFEYRQNVVTSGIIITF